MNTVARTQTDPLKLIIIGGGYAGLSALITLRKQAPDDEITLIDPRPYHLIITAESSGIGAVDTEYSAGSTKAINQIDPDFC